MAQIFKILKAWRNVFNNVTTDEHKKRSEICKECDLSVYRKYTDFINDELKEVRGFVCSECDCPLIAKIRSTDKCPIGKW